VLPPHAIDPSSPRLPNGQENQRFGALIPMPSHDLVPMGGMPWHSAPAAQALAPPVTAGNLLHSLRRRWWIGAGFGVLCAIGAALAAWNLIPSNQTVSSTLVVRRGDEMSLDAYKRPQSAEEVMAFKLTQAGMMKQRLSLANALGTRDTETGFDLWKSPEVRKHKDPVGWLEQELSVDFFEGSDLMLVTLRGEDPKELAKIVNAIVNVFLKESKQLYEAELTRMRVDIDKKIEDAQTNLNSTHEKLMELAKSLGVGDREGLAASHQAKLQLLNTLNQQVMSSESALMRMEQDIAQYEVELKTLQNRQIGDYEIEAHLLKDPIYQDKMKELDKLRQYVSRVMGSVKDPKSNKVRHVLNTLKSLEDEITQHRDSIRPAIEATLVDPSRAQHLAENIARLKEARDNLMASLNEKNGQLNELRNQLSQMGGGSSLLDMQQQRKQMYVTELQELHAARRKLAMMAAQPPRVQRLVEAAMPDSSSDMLRYLAVVIGAAFGFGLPIVGIMFWDFQQHRVNHPNDASTALGTKILGALPSVAGRKGRKATDQGKAQAANSQLQRLLADSVDGVRTALLRDTAAEGTRVVLVTSAVHHEGKTTLATQLAASLARAGKRTLLIDGDLRKPVAHRLYGLSLDPGLCEVLRGECELEETLRPTRASGLWMMTAGRCDDESLHELAKEGVDEIFKQLRSAFDYIIIDASPVLASADALVMGQYVDAAVMSVLRDASRVPKVFEACDRLRGVGVRVMGTVFNGSKQDVKPVNTTKRLPSKAAAL
jgi:capsular exopolysaccharide synthesis family protein